jgi:urease accessory protein
MRRAIDVRPSGQWNLAALITTVTLPFDERHRRRIRMTDDRGEDFLLDLSEAALLCEGDGLALDEGGFIRVCAAEEPVADIHCGNAEQAARIAWHIGNRHTPVQVLPGGTLRIRDDHVLVAMVEGLGATVERTKAPFAPEPGAYAKTGHSHEHDHDHDHRHSHDRHHSH